MFIDTRLARLGFVAVAAAVFVAVAWVCLGPSGSGTAVTSAAPVSIPARPLEPFAYGLSPGHAYRYTFRQGTTVLRGGSRYAEVTSQGTLEAHVVQATAEDVDLIVRAIYTVAGNREAASTERATLKGEGTAHLKLARNGRVLRLGFPAGPAESGDARLLASAIASWLYVLPDFDQVEARNPPYPAEATDPQGHFTSEYSVDGQLSDALDLRMRKLAYTRASTLTRIASSDHRIRWDVRQGLLLQASSEDRYAKGPRELGLESLERAETSFVEVVPAAFTSADLARYTQGSELYVPPPPPARVATAVGDQAVKPWLELRAELARLPVDPTSEAPLELFGTLATSLALDPGMLAAVLDEAHRWPSSSAQFRMLLGAISNLGSPEAQAGLIALFATADPQGRDLIVKAQNLMAAPSTGATRSMLLRTYDDPDLSALKEVTGFALGSSLRNPDGDTASIDAARQRIRAMWAQAGTLAEKEYVLNVIGNTGDTAFLDIVRSELANPTSAHRERALDAMRFMEDAESAGMLFEALGQHGAPDLQKAALDSLFHHGWQPGFFEPLSACFLHAPSTSIRIGCARVILQQPAEEQQMQGLLEQVRSGGGLDAELRAFIDERLS